MWAGSREAASSYSGQPRVRSNFHWANKGVARCPEAAKVGMGESTARCCHLENPTWGAGLVLSLEQGPVCQRETEKRVVWVLQYIAFSNKGQCNMGASAIVMFVGQKVKRDWGFPHHLAYSPFSKKQKHNQSAAPWKSTRTPELYLRILPLTQLLDHSSSYPTWVWYYWL